MVNEDLRAFFMQTPVVNGWLFYSVLNHANYNATGAGLEFIYKPVIPSHKVSKIYLHLLLPLLPADRIGANIAIWRKKVPFGLFVCRHLAFSVVGIITYLLM